MADPALSGAIRPGSARRWLAGCLLAGIGTGALWRLLIPVLIDPSDPEGAVAVDGVLALLCLAVGLAVGILLAVLPTEVHWRRFILVLFASVVGAVAAWATGLVLGVRQLGAGGAPLLWPAATSGVTFVSALVAGLSRSGRPSDASAGDLRHVAGSQNQQVGGTEFHVQAAPSGADQNGGVVEGAAVEHGGQRLPLTQRADPSQDVAG